MENIFRLLKEIDDKAQKIVNDAVEKSIEWEKKTRKRIEARLIQAKTEARKQETSVKDEYYSKIAQLEEKFKTEVESEIETINKLVQSNWDKALKRGIEILEQII
ncbi:MAG: hypothetical protein ACTSU9_14410 [Promethearchaeota archaeon]